MRLAALREGLDDDHAAAAARTGMRAGWRLGVIGGSRIGGLVAAPKRASAYPVPYALETDWPVGAAGIETLHQEFVSRRLQCCRAVRRGQIVHAPCAIRCLYLRCTITAGAIAQDS